MPTTELENVPALPPSENQEPDAEADEGGLLDEVNKLLDADPDPGDLDDPDDVNKPWEEGETPAPYPDYVFWCSVPHCIVNPSYTSSHNTSANIHSFPNVTMGLMMLQLFVGRLYQKCISFVISAVSVRCEDTSGCLGMLRRSGNSGCVQHLHMYHDCGQQWVLRTFGDN
jgi:hypothetical protein